jgi:acetyl-CoA carboxylase biotin carboxyl carrier protein
MTQSEQPSLFDVEVLSGVLDELARSDVEELEIASGDSRLYAKRSATPPRDPIEAQSTLVETSEEGVHLLAPLTGIFYARPDPQEPPFVSVGDSVEMGQVVALIETMKLFNEVTCDVPGQVLKIMVREEELIEVHQPIFLIGPSLGSASV